MGGACCAVSRPELPTYAQGMYNTCSAGCGGRSSSRLQKKDNWCMHTKLLLVKKCWLIRHFMVRVHSSSTATFTCPLKHSEQAASKTAGCLWMLSCTLSTLLVQQCSQQSELQGMLLVHTLQQSAAVAAYSAVPHAYTASMQPQRALCKQLLKKGTPAVAQDHVVWLLWRIPDAYSKLLFKLSCAFSWACLVAAHA
jgi:hypothetical protein